MSKQSDLVNITQGDADITGSSATFSGNLTVDSDTLFVDAASNNVGIGTSSPADRLSLEVGSANQGVSLYFSGVEVGSFRNDEGNATINANNASLKLSTGGTERMRIDSSGHLTPGTNNTYDLGSSSLRWRNIYTNDLNLSNGIGDYTIVEGEEDLFLYNNKTGKVFKFALIEVDPSEATPKAKQ